MDNIENIKNMWLELDRRISSLEEENRRLVRQVVNGKYKNIQEKLARKYIAFIIIECIMIFYMFLMISYNPFVVEKYKIPTLIYWTAFFLIEVFIDSYLFYKIKSIDIYHSSVSEIAAQAARNWKIHKLAILFGIPVAVGAVIMFALLIDANIYTLIGIITGGIVGSIIGCWQLLKFKNYYKLLKSEDN